LPAVSAATLIGGDADDILIAGTTSWDTNPNWKTAFASIMAEWARTDLGFDDRVQHIQNGGGLNGSYVLDGSTVSNNGGGNTLLGHFLGLTNRDLYFERMAGDVDDLQLIWLSSSDN
jgi:hypothetical protein